MTENESCPSGSEPTSGAVEGTEQSDRPGAEPQSEGRSQEQDPGESAAAQEDPRPNADVFLRGPAELAEALPYLLGFYPDDSIVVVAVHGERGRFGGRIRVGIPASPTEWEAIASQVAECLRASSRARGASPDGAVVYLCREPVEGDTGEDVKEYLRPLAHRLRLSCGELEMPVYEALCLSGERCFSYCCPDSRCCPSEGIPLTSEGTSPIAAAAAYSGTRVHGSIRDMDKRLVALGPPLDGLQERTLDSVGAALVSRMLTADGRTKVRAETLALAERLIDRFRDAVPRPSEEHSAQDAHDDGLLSHREAASLILGLQDRRTRDRAAEWMEGPDVGPALRLWRAVARRCVGPYGEHAAAPLALVGWVAWSGGEVPTARVALSRALRIDADYVFAQLLHQACNEGLDPELLRKCMREERALRNARAAQRRTEPGPARRGAP